MASWDRREYTVRTIEYAVRDGAAIGEFMKAHIAALAGYRKLNGLTDDTAVFDDWATVHVTDDGVTIRFAVQEQVRAVNG
ncbi:hypothetical protein [Verrucosispora sp. NA02020]|uniref:hypothetical protein n=1 Tax=Verrucosispora sp. NA02020 TaxID=2742132 RepID=UPI001590E75F|nr:hypothetical protein [Verrucosispora sp. NA02020]QKW15330.1 hypothetical protein HUT12_22925 [Verrucosispora sp. NA02020]